ncbi:hypothetical protein CcaverHIS641_0511580 [Cutaneotrichosporon cavernicola]|nr:hypothetical protein CcaverHIS641_0511580 [Cutaneotrichosporon cavernicola]
MIQAHSSPAPISFPSIVYKADVGSFPASHHLLSRSLLFTLHACGNEIVILILSHRHPPNLVAVNGPGPATAGSALRSNGRIQTVLICVGSGPNGLGLYQKQADFAHFWNLFEMTWSAISGGLSPEMRGFDRPALLALPLVQDTFCTYFEALFSWLTPAEQDNWAKCFEVKWMVTIVQPGGQQASLEECAFLIACERFWSVIHLSWMSEGIPMYNVQYHITPTDPLVHLVVQTIRHTLGIMSLEDKIEWIRHYGILQRRAGHSIPPEVVAWYILKGEEHYESVCNGSEDAPSESWFLETIGELWKKAETKLSSALGSNLEQNSSRLHHQELKYALGIMCLDNKIN